LLELFDKALLYTTVCLTCLPWIVVIIIGIRGGKVTVEFGRNNKEATTNAKTETPQTT